MDWINRMNDALSYIEEHLDGTIQYDEIAKITLCSIGAFQRFFMLASGIALSEYIRRRRLSLAAKDVLNTEDKIIDIAFRYGYETPDAFTVAFKRLFDVTPSTARNSGSPLKTYYRMFFSLSVTYVKGEDEMILMKVDKYQYKEPLFEGARIVLSYLGSNFSPEYIGGISGAAFKIAGGCPSRPTCVYDAWTPDFIKSLGYSIREMPCGNEYENNQMIQAVKEYISAGKPALVWHAFTNAEWDVVCGFDEQQKQFIGRGSYLGNTEYERASWDRAASCDICPPFGAIMIGECSGNFDNKKAEKNALLNAVTNARKKTDKSGGTELHLLQGIEFYQEWARLYSQPGKERDAADAYCWDIYSSVRKAAVIFLREISLKYSEAAKDSLRRAADMFEEETGYLERARPYLSWDSPWGIDEERSSAVAPLLKYAAISYEKAITFLENSLSIIDGIL